MIGAKTVTGNDLNILNMNGISIVRCIKIGLKVKRVGGYGNEYPS
mgnify:CR=1 FL=1